MKKSAFAKALETTKVDKPTATKKSSMPLLSKAETAKEVRIAVDSVNEAKAELKAAKAKLAKNETVVINFVKPVQDRDAYAGNHSKSYEVEGNKGSVKFVSANKFSVSSEDEENLLELLGEERFNERFEKKESLSVKAEIFTNDKLQAEMMELMGDKFSLFFEYTATLKVKEDFDRKQYALNESELADLRVFAKQAKPALK